jgi:hypothetical protein
MKTVFFKGLLSALLVLSLVFIPAVPVFASGNFGAQGWNLDSHEDDDDLTPSWLCQMEKKDGPGDNGQSGQITLAANGGSQIWIADEAANDNVVFLSVSTSWDLELVTDVNWNAAHIQSNCVVEIGEWDGVNFNKFDSVKQWKTIYNNGTIYLTFLNQTENENVRKNCFLAIRVTNHENIDHVIITEEGTGSSCLSSTPGDPGYPNPGPKPVPVSSWTGTGLMIGGFAVLITVLLKTRHKRPA